MKRHGTISILLALLLPVLLLFFMAAFETLWESLARVRFDQACTAAARSAMSGYDRTVEEARGLFVLADAPTCEELDEWMQGNLDEDRWMQLDTHCVRAEGVAPLAGQHLQAQMLESVKYSAPVRGAKALRDMASSMRLARGFSDSADRARRLERAQDNLEQTTRNNRRIKRKKKDIRSLSRKRAAEREATVPDEARIRSLDRSIRAKRRTIDGLYRQNQELTYETQEILRDCGVDEVPAVRRESVDVKPALREDFERLAQAKALCEERLGRSLEPDGARSARDAQTRRTVRTGLDLAERAGEALRGARDGWYLSEYALSYLDNALSDGSEVEYVITGSDRPRLAYGARLLLERTALDAIGYFALDPKAPPELLSRTVYALVMGGVQGAVDLYRMVGREERVPLVHVTPHGTNPLQRVKVSYEDHQRLDLLLTGRTEKMARLARCVDVSGLCAARFAFVGSVRQVFPLTFRPGLGRLRDGRVRFTKEMRLWY